MDRWQVVARHLWLVAGLIVVSIAAAAWAVSQRPPQYRSSLSMQVNDPWQRTRSLTRVGSMAAADAFVDPIQSEIEVLGSTPIASAVVDSLGLRLTSDPTGPHRSELIERARIADDVPSGQYFLTYDESGRVAFEDAGGTTLATAPAGEPMEGDDVLIVAHPAPSDARRYPLLVRPRDDAILEVRAGVNAIARESTNIIDASYIGPDPGLSALVLDRAAMALREYGARRVAQQASREVEFIEQRLDSASVQLGRSLTEVREFKESRAFLDLSLQEQALVTQSELLETRAAELESQRRVLSAILRRVGDGAGPINDIQVLAELPSSLNPQLTEVVGRLQLRREEVTRLVTTERKTETHPEVVALRSQISGLETELLDAMRATLGAVEDRLVAANRARGNLREEQRRFPGLVNQLQTLELQQNLDQGTYEFLLSQLYQARITEAAASPYVEVLDPASSVQPIRPSRWLALSFGLLLGLSLGLGVAFFLEYVDRTLRTSADIHATLGVPVLGVIPQLEVVSGDGSVSNGTGRPLLIALDPGDPAAEAYRTLRLNLMYSDGHLNGVRTVNFTSAGPNEGKSTSALNFAVLVARQRERVLLVEADLRRPRLSITLQLESDPGLSEVLRGQLDADAAIRRDVLPNLDVLPSGSETDNPSDLLNSRAMEKLLGALESRYNYVVIDSPPILAVTDAAVLAAHADGSVLVVRSGHTDQRAARRAMDQLHRVGVRVLGAVLNEVPPNVTEESYYFKYIYSYYERGSRPGSRKPIRPAAVG